jgi:4-hydroxybenzoate polyprenyltransferase
MQNFLNYFPIWVRPWVELARYDKPIGYLLLFWPCVLSLLLASIETSRGFPLYYIFLFFLGAVVMRGAGCTWNDFLDKDYDAKVERTKDRPLASRKITNFGTIFFLVLQLALGLLILLQFNKLTIYLGALSLFPIFLYPLMKRITWWPQIFLGITFNWGALLGWSSINNEISISTILLYLGCIFWTLGYDTIYAHQDKRDDILLGLKSSAIRLGKNTKKFLVFVYLIAFILIATASYMVIENLLILIFLPLIFLHLNLQIYFLDTENPTSCLKIFKSNNLLGLLLSLLFFIEIITNFFY